MAGGLRNLVVDISFRLNRAQLARAENRIRSAGIGLGRLGIAMTVGVTLPILRLGQGFVTAASELEVLDKTLGAFLGNAEKAIAFRKELFEFAKESPLLTVREIGQQAQRLLGIGIAAREVIPVLKTLGTIAGVTRAPLNRIVKAFVDVRQQGVLQGQEVRQFAQNSIGIIQLLSKSLGKSIKEVTELQTAQKISFVQVRQALELMGGPGSRAAKAIEAIAVSTLGRFRKLQDSFFIFQASIGKLLLPIVNSLIDTGNELMETLDNMSIRAKRFSLVVLGVTAAAGPFLLFLKLARFLFNQIAKRVLFAIAVLSLFIDDLIVWQQNGKSVLGRVLGDYDEFMQKAKMVWGTLSDFFRKDLPNAFKEAVDIMKREWDLFNKVLDESGTKDFFRDMWDLSVDIFSDNIDFLMFKLGIFTEALGLVLAGNFKRAGAILGRTGVSKEEFLKARATKEGLAGLFKKRDATKAGDEKITSDAFKRPLTTLFNLVFNQEALNIFAQANREAVQFFKDFGKFITGEGAEKLRAGGKGLQERALNVNFGDVNIKIDTKNADTKQVMDMIVPAVKDGILGAAREVSTNNQQLEVVGAK